MFFLFFGYCPKIKKPEIFGLKQVLEMNSLVNGVCNNVLLVIPSLTDSHMYYHCSNLVCVTVITNSVQIPSV